MLLNGSRLLYIFPTFEVHTGILTLEQFIASQFGNQPSPVANRVQEGSITILQAQ